MKYFFSFLFLTFVSCTKEDVLLPKKPEVVAVVPEPKVVEPAYTPIQFENVNEYLATPAAGAKLIIPVIIINYIQVRIKGKLWTKQHFRSEMIKELLILTYL